MGRLREAEMTTHQALLVSLADATFKNKPEAESRTEEENEAILDAIAILEEFNVSS